MTRHPPRPFVLSLSKDEIAPPRGPRPSTGSGRTEVCVSFALLLALAACGPSNRSLDTQKAPVVAFSEMSYDLKPTGEHIDGEQLHAFASYLRAVGVGYGDRVSVGGATMAQQAIVAAIVGAYGAAVEPGAPAATGIIHVAIRHSSVTVPGCPDWRRVSNPEIDGSTMSNYGCASRSNLAAMVADPNDLIEGKAFTGSDSAVIVKGIKAYRDKPARDEKFVRSLDLSTTTEAK